MSTKSSCRKAIAWCCVCGPSFDAVSAACRWKADGDVLVPVHEPWSLSDPFSGQWLSPEPLLYFEG